MRTERGWSTNRLSIRSGVSQSTLSSIEAGKGNPNLDSIERLCKAFDMTLSEFFAEEDTELPMFVKRLINAAEGMTSRQIEFLSEFLKSMQEGDSENSTNHDTPEPEQAEIIAAHMESEYGVHNPELAEEVMRILNESTERKREAIKRGEWRSKRKR